jgi:hypothetical protein
MIQQIDLIINDNSLKFSQVVKGLGITGADFAAAAKNVVAAVDGSKAALLDLGLAFFKAYGNNGNGGGNNGGFSGIGGSPSDGITVTTENGTTMLTFDANKIIDAFKSASKYIIDATARGGDVSIVLPASALQEALTSASSGVIVIEFEGSTYVLPLNVLDAAALAKGLNADVKDLKMILHMNKATGTILEEIKKKADQAGMKLLGTPIEFTLSAVAGDKKTDIISFGNNYISKYLKLGDKVDPNTTTGLIYNTSTGQFSFVPSLFDVASGGTNVTIQRNGNSIYLLVGNSKTFADIKGHWAQSDIELLASKLLLQGMTDTTYDPEGNVTRAQFSAMLVRALGLIEDSSSSQFTDVSAAAWYAGSVGAAVKAGIIEGFEDGSFRPDDSITREQMMVMMSRALSFVGKPLSSKSSADVLAKFDDEGRIGSWAKKAAALEVEAGLIFGISDKSLAPKDEVTRAQAAALLKRLLQYAHFIN